MSNHHIFIILFLPLSLFLISLFLFKYLQNFFNKSFFIDSPTHRSNHNIPTPKGAGLIVIPLVIFSTLSVFFFTNSLNLGWIIFIISICLLTIISFFDDLFNVSLIVRLIVQSLCVFVSIYFLFDQLSLSDFYINIVSNININKAFLDFCILVIVSAFWMWIINLYNFMDGMDGITASQVCFFMLGVNILAVFGFLNFDLQLFSLIVFSVCLGFYSVNKPPAKIFLGDTGAIPLGYMVGLIIIKALFFYNLFIPVLILSMYHIVDSTLTIVIRLMNGDNIFEAHSSHFYQKIIRSGFSHDYVLARIHYMNFILLIMSFISIIYPISCFIISFILTLGLLKIFSSKGIKQ